MPRPVALSSVLVAAAVSLVLAQPDPADPTPLYDKHYQYPDGIPYQVDYNTAAIRGPQVGYNICNSTTEDQDSMCQTSFVNHIDDFCLWAPPKPNSTIGDTEAEEVAWCTKPGHGTRLIPDGALQGVQVLKTPDYIQIAGYIDQSQINLTPDDYGGELDPHGADLRGNPLGGLMYSNAFPGSNGDNNTYLQVSDWTNFMGGHTFCIKVCDPSKTTGPAYCQNIYDRLGCLYNAPNNAKNGTFEVCDADNMTPPGVYVSGGQTMTYFQPPESLGAITTVPYTPVVPSSSNCVTYTSAALYTGLPKGTDAAVSGTGATGTHTGSSSAAQATSNGAGSSLPGGARRPAPQDRCCATNPIKPLPSPLASTRLDIVPSIHLHHDRSNQRTPHLMIVPRVPKKAQKLGRALKTAARLPARVSGGRGSGRNRLSPSPGEQPVVLLRVQVIGCRDLAPRSKNASCDPFVVVSLLNTRHHTPVSKRTANPDYKDATFDFTLYLSLADRLGTLEIVVWDKDGMLKKEYLGEVALPLEDWFRDGCGFGFHDDRNKPQSLRLVSTRAGTSPSGSVQIKLGFVSPPLHPSAGPSMSFEQVFSELNRRSRPSLVSAPPTEGIGTLRSHLSGPLYDDDGGISSDEEDDANSEDEEEDELGIPQLSRLQIPASPIRDRDKDKDQGGSRSPGTARPSPHVDTATPTPTTPTNRTKLPKFFPRRPPLSTRSSYEPAPVVPVVAVTAAAVAAAAAVDVPAITVAPAPAPAPAPVPAPATVSAPASAAPHAAPPPPPPLIVTECGHRRSMSAGAIPTMTQHSKRKFRTSWASSSKHAGYNFSAANDIVGIVMLEIKGATDLPKLKNMTRTGWDMDPFVVISFGKKVFRTRVIRHSLNPVWDEKLLFHVRRYETSFKVMLTVLDWDKLSSNDYVGDARFDVAELVKDSPQPDPCTGLYDLGQEGRHEMKEFVLPLVTGKEAAWEAKHTPMLQIRAKFQPYDALRQRFWAQYLREYDADDTSTLSRVELTSMLDSLGSTLSAQTIDSFYLRHGKRPA
ncbi:hypothetical protein ID866_6202, partial [Astraeus odoratus]